MSSLLLLLQVSMELRLNRYDKAGSAGNGWFFRRRKCALSVFNHPLDYPFQPVPCRLPGSGCKNNHHGQSLLQLNA